MMKKHFKSNFEGKELSDKLDEITNEKAGTVQEIFWNPQSGTYNVIWYITGTRHNYEIKSDLSTSAITQYTTETVWPAWYQEEQNTHWHWFPKREDVTGYIDAVYSHGGVLKKVEATEDGVEVTSVIPPENSERFLVATGVRSEKSYAAPAKP